MMQLSRALWRHGKTQRAREVAPTQSRCSKHDPGPDLVLAYGRMAALDVLAGRSEEAVEWADKGIELASEIRFENVTRALGMRGLARARPRRSRRPRRSPFGGRACARARSAGRGHRDRVSAISGSIDGLTEGIARGPRADGGEPRVRAPRGHVHHVMYVRTNLLSVPLPRGPLGRAPREADELIEWDRERGGTQIELWALVRLCPDVLAHRGQATRAADLVSTGVAPGATRSATLRRSSPARCAAALAAMREGDLARAGAMLAEYETTRRRVASSASTSELRVWLGPWLLSAVDGVAGVERLLERRRSRGRPCGQHARAHAHALVAEASGATDEAAGSSPRQQRAGGLGLGAATGVRAARPWRVLGRCGGARARARRSSPVSARRPSTARVGVGASAAGVGAGRRRALLGLRQLGGGERGAVEDVALGHLDLGEAVGRHAPRAGRSRRRRSRTRGRARFPEARRARSVVMAASRSSCSSTDASERRWPCVRAGSYSASPRSSVASVVTVPATPIALPRPRARGGASARTPLAAASSGRDGGSDAEEPLGEAHAADVEARRERDLAVRRHHELGRAAADVDDEHVVERRPAGGDAADHHRRPLPRRRAAAS